MSTTNDPQGAQPKRLVLYTPNERFWHWMQAGLIFGLMLTGGAIRAPDAFGWVNFKAAVYTHNILAALLLIHAVLGIFFFINSGQIRHYKVERKGFVNGLIKQITYYGYGIFRGAMHPFEPSEEKRLNLLQRLSYLGILNFLLPLQIASGLLIFFAGEQSALVATLGGMPVIITVHALAAWFFLVFTFMHIYLTTTGDTVFEHLMVMVRGYKEEGDHHKHQEPS